MVVLVLWQLELNGILLLGAAGPAVEFRVVDALSGDPIERARISLRKDGAAGNDYWPPPQWVHAVACDVTVRPLLCTTRTHEHSTTYEQHTAPTSHSS